ncbi:YitT family protein, partial [Lactococcus lactis subsp. lactis]|nr:YitT family protein [Lactococcus lactis subsp. lactis]
NFFVTLLSCYIFSKVTRLIGRPSYRQQILQKVGLIKNESNCSCTTNECSCSN